MRPEELRALSVSTYRLAASEIGRGHFAKARALGRATEGEAREGHELYPMFIERARAFLLASGVTAEQLADEERRIADALRLPDGSRFDMEAGWSRYQTALSDLEDCCDRKDGAGALLALEQAREEWRQTHDRACDLIYGLLDVCARLLGEDRIGAMWDDLMASLYPGRDRYDVRIRPWSDSVADLVTDAAVSLRGHLSGPDRSGEIEIEELPDRFVLRFDPCGSGGRTLGPDAPEDGPPRMEPPFNFATTTRQHDWAWNTKGVCLYCVHCCQLQERVPIRRLGYPVRVVDPPVWPDVKRTCTWTVYKDPSLVPAEEYRRVGMDAPEQHPGEAERRGG